MSQTIEVAQAEAQAYREALERIAGLGEVTTRLADATGIARAALAAQDSYRHSRRRADSNRCYVREVGFGGKGS